MPISKKDEFPEDIAAQAALHAALGHPARIAILNALAAQESCVCGELVSNLPLAQATVSQHLKVLKEVGLIKGTIDGPRTCYCIDPKAAAKMSLLFGELAGKLRSKERMGESCKPKTPKT